MSMARAVFVNRCVSGVWGVQGLLQDVDVEAERLAEVNAGVGTEGGDADAGAGAEGGSAGVGAEDGDAALTLTRAAPIFCGEGCGAIAAHVLEADMHTDWI